MYGYTYPSAMLEFLQDGYILVKVGDSHRDVDVRMDEQGSSAEWQRMIKIGRWNNLKKIDRDYRVHEILSARGLHHKGGKGTEWFKIPSKNLDEAFAYIDQIIADLEGGKIRGKVTLRQLQQQTLDQAMQIIDYCASNGLDSTTLIANLCPRFGKTIWALSLFNRITEKYGNRVMLLPAYWLSVHTSFVGNNNSGGELDKFSDFLHIREINVDEPGAMELAHEYLRQGLRIVIPISLHGDQAEWETKHQWIADIPNDEIYVFADEGDFGTHTENQASKLSFLFDK